MGILKKIDAKGPKNWDKEKIKEENNELIEQIAELQRILYAEQKHSILLILQGVDAAGKDGTVRNIFSAVNPLGCKVFSFKKPTPTEMSYDYLWRVHQVVPPKGMIHIFNRSHYEDILVPTVLKTHDKKEIEKRYDQINSFEKLIESNGTKIIKCYLHISPDEQLERLNERIENPTKHWKHNDGDWSSRKLWDDYMEVYETIFEKCDKIPWQIIPADRNWVKINFVAKTIVKEMEKMKLKWPALESDKFSIKI